MDGVRVLVVEDDVRMAAALRRGLGFEGLVVDLAGDGEEALRMAGAYAYEAVVLDVMLPGIDGFETCRRLRAGRCGRAAGRPPGRWAERERRRSG